MRLWHEKLIPHLPTKQLLGQHRECCALRGNGWGKKHSTVDYVFRHNPMTLVFYHLKIIQEMRNRGYSVSSEWCYSNYRGQNCSSWDDRYLIVDPTIDSICYAEHDEEYLVECLDNLYDKGIDIQV